MPRGALDLTFASPNLGQCPDSEFRIIVRHPRLRTSESKDMGNLLIQCGFGFEVRMTGSRRE